jgi:hypothetical protein
LIEEEINFLKSKLEVGGCCLGGPKKFGEKKRKEKKKNRNFDEIMNGPKSGIQAHRS